MDNRNEDDSYHWAKTPEDLLSLVIPDVPRPDREIDPLLYEQEYRQAFENMPPRHEDTQGLDPGYWLVPPKPIDAALMTQLSFNNTFSDIFTEIGSPYFLYPNYNPRIGGHYKCYICARPLDIPFLQEPDEGPFQLDVDAPWEATCWLWGCGHILGMDCALSWMRGKYPNKEQDIWYRWTNGQLAEEEIDVDMRQTITHYQENPHLLNWITEACPICAASIQVETNYGETLDIWESNFAPQNVTYFNRDACETIATKMRMMANEDANRPENHPDLAESVILSKKVYDRLVVIQLKTWRRMQALHKRLGAPEYREIGGGPYNMLDHVYLRNLLYDKLLTNRLGDFLFEQHLNRPDDSDDDDDDDDDDGDGGGWYYDDSDGAPPPPPPPTDTVAKRPKRGRPVGSRKRLPLPGEMGMPGGPPHPGYPPVPNPWPLDYDTPPDSDPHKCPYCDRTFIRTDSNRRHQYARHGRPDLGKPGFYARLERRHRKKKEEEAQKRASNPNYRVKPLKPFDKWSQQGPRSQQANGSQVQPLAP
ncbi:hypothetical protein QBC40DRAFT_196336, partial [Triangularia verruculosa]